MEIPELKEILLVWDPKSIEEKDNFVMPAHAMIGTSGTDGADCFFFRIMTPKKVAYFVERDKFLMG